MCVFGLKSVIYRECQGGRKISVHLFAWIFFFYSTESQLNSKRRLREPLQEVLLNQTGLMVTVDMTMGFYDTLYLLKICSKLT